MEEKKEVAYNASAIVNIFSNALNSEATKKIIKAKGLYVPGRGQNYNGVYYDQLKDETSDACITLIVPAITRVNLEANKIIECHAFLTKKVLVNGGRIELQLNVTELLAQNESQFSEEQIQSFKILQRKAEIGYRDVDSFVKAKIIKEEPIKIIILFGKTGIIDHDIKYQLEETISFYDIEFIRINLSSETEIIAALEQHHEVADVLVLSRGGGDNLSIFNKPAIAQAALALSSHFVTAIGHQQDNSLLQKVADKGFITPTAFGQYLSDIYNNTIGELQDSKAKLVDDITKQLQANYEQKIRNLEEQIKAKEEAHGKASEGTQVLYKKEVEMLKQQATVVSTQHQNRIMELQRFHEEKLRLAGKNQPNIITYVILFIVAIILGIIIGKPYTNDNQKSHLNW